jgi:hypothetical protein
MKNRDGNCALCCNKCNQKIEEMERVYCCDFDDIIAEYHHCSECADKKSYLSDASIRRFLVGNVI